MMGARELRAFCRPPMGVPVSFAGVSTYTDDGSPICGMFDRPIGFKLQEQGLGGIENATPELRLPRDAFNPMPQSGDTITVDGTPYTVSQPGAEDDGAFLVYDLYATTL